jgi:hypothetical protein
MRTDKPIAFECRFAFHCTSKGSDNDYHLVKEVAHFKDGTTEPRIRMVKNYQRTIYVTKKGMRNHTSKKEFEKIEHLTPFKTNQVGLLSTCAKALGQAWYRGGLRDLANSPYLYGADIDSAALIKQYYMDTFPDYKSPYSVAVFDVETDIFDRRKPIVMATVSMKDKSITAIRANFLSKIANPLEQLKETAERYIGEKLKKRGITPEFVIVDSETDVVKVTMAKAHEWRPDFMAVWNITFDIRRVMEAFERAGERIEDVLCDPAVPQEYRDFYFKEGPAKMITASGVVKVLKPAHRWHHVFCPASFVWVDAMCAYSRIRQGSREEPSYSLEAITKKHGLTGKLKFEEAERYTGGAKHKYLQSKFPVEYCVYNLYDCIVMEELDEIIKDLSIFLPMYAGCSDFSRFNSQPRRKVDKLHHDFFKKGLVIATTGSEMDDGFNHLVVTLDDWIVMLDPHLVTQEGLRCIIEDRTLTTNLIACVFDLDVSASYPTGQVVMNISKATTVTEIIRNMDAAIEKRRRMNTINFTSGHVNALEFCEEMSNMPTLEEIGARYLAEKQAKENSGVEASRAIEYAMQTSRLTNLTA